MDLLDYINPLKYSTPDKYISWWQVAFTTVFKSFWAKVLAWVSLFLSYWLGINKKRLRLGFFFIFIAVAIAYGSPVLKFFGLIK